MLIANAAAAAAADDDDDDDADYCRQVASARLSIVNPRLSPRPVHGK